MEEEHSELGKRIIESLEEAIRFARGEDTGARVTYATRPPSYKAHVERPPWYPPYLVREIREKLGVSQEIFGQMLGVSTSTVRAWETGKRECEGPASRLLQIAEAHPDVLKEVCGEIIPAAPGLPRARVPRAVRAPATDEKRTPGLPRARVPRAVRAPATDEKRLAADKGK